MLSDFPEVTQLPWAFFGRMKQLPKPYLFFFFFCLKKIFIYLAVLGLSYGMWDL